MIYSLAVVVAVVLAVALFAVKVVPIGVEVPVERLGRYVRMAGPGLHLVVPVVDRFRTPVSTREETLRTTARPFATADGNEQVLTAAVTWRVTDARAATYEVGDYRLAVEQILFTVLRNFVSARDLHETWVHSEDIAREAEQLVADACRPWGLAVSRLEVDGWRR